LAFVTIPANGLGEGAILQYRDRKTKPGAIRRNTKNPAGGFSSKSVQVQMVKNVREKK
jgi:hypothetical protein